MACILIYLFAFQSIPIMIHTNAHMLNMNAIGMQGLGLWAAQADTCGSRSNFYIILHEQINRLFDGGFITIMV
jgi:hypothetical protein